MLAVVAVSLFACAWAWQGRYAVRARTFQYDFVAFYCGARIAMSQENPYLIEPLRSCEHRESTIFGPRSRLVVPAPLPPYALALLRPLAAIPFLAARAVWLALQLVAYGAFVALVFRMTGLAVGTIVAATLFSVLYPSLTLGQVVPIVVFGLTLAAYGIERERPSLIAFGLLCASIEPHVAAPAFASAIALSRCARFATIGVASILGALSFATAGPTRTIDYLTNVLGAHALSEAKNQEQYGLTYLLGGLGASPETALRVGHVAFIIALVIGIAVAARLAVTTRRAAFVILAPPAFALLASVFLHIQQFAIALPFVLLLAAISSSRPARASVAGLAVPWGFFYSLVPVAPLASFAFGYLAERLIGLSRRTAILASLLAFAALSVAEYLRPIASAAFPWERYARVPTTELAEALWKPLIDFGFHSAPTLYAAVKIPTFAALIAGVAAACALIRVPRRGRAETSEGIALQT